LIMKKKIFTLLASALMLFMTAFASYGQPWLGTAVTGLPDGVEKNAYHLRLVKLGANPLPANEIDATTGAVLAVDGAGNLVIRDASYYATPKPLENLYRTLWCVHKDVYTSTHATQLQFTNRQTLADLSASIQPPARINYLAGSTDAKVARGWKSVFTKDKLTEEEAKKYTWNGDSLSIASWFYNYTTFNIPGGKPANFGAVVLGGSELDYWEGGNTYNSFLDTFYLRVRVPNEPDFYYTLAVPDTAKANLDGRGLYLAKVHENDFEKGAPFAETHLARFALTSTVPRLLTDPKDIKSLLGPGGLGTEHKTGDGDPFKNITDVEEVPGNGAYVRLKTAKGYITVLDGDPASNYYDGLGYLYPKIESQPLSTTGRSDFRLVYYPSEGNVLMNVRAIKRYNDATEVRDEVSSKFLSSSSGNYWESPDPEDGLVDTDSYFTRTIADNLIVQAQQLSTSSEIEKEVPTVGLASVFNTTSSGVWTHYYFPLSRELGCAEIEEARSTAESGLYLIKNEDGQYLTVPLYAGSFAPVWLNAQESDALLTPAFHWLVKKLDGSPVSKVSLINREFSKVQFEYVQIYTDRRPFKNGWTIDNNQYGTLLGEALVGASDYVHITDPKYLSDPSLGYKRIGAEAAESYSFKYYHQIAQSAQRELYVSAALSDIKKDTTLSVTDDPNKLTYFHFRKPDLPTEQYGITKSEYAAAKITGIVPEPLVRERYIFEINTYSTAAGNGNVLTLREDQGYVHTNEATINENTFGKKGEFFLRYTHAVNGEPHYTILHAVGESDFPKISQIYGYDLTYDLWGTDPASPAESGEAGTSDKHFGVLLFSVDDRDLVVRAKPRYGTNNLQSTFALEANPEPFYRRLDAAGLGTTEEIDEEKPVVVKIYRAASKPPFADYLYEDQHSPISSIDPKDDPVFGGSHYGNGIHYLSWTNKATDDAYDKMDAGARFPHNFGLYVERAYFDPNESQMKPQYLIAVDVEEDQLGFPANCPTCTGGQKVSALNYKYGRYLVNTRDSGYVNESLNSPIRDPRYLSGNRPRLAFVDAVYVKSEKKLYILPLQTKYQPDNTGNYYKGAPYNGERPIDKYIDTLAGPYTTPEGDTYPEGTKYLNFQKLVYGQYELDAAGNATDKPLVVGIGEGSVKDVNTHDHKNWLFSFRFVDPEEGPTGKFYIESEVHTAGEWFAPTDGGWLKTGHEGLVEISRDIISYKISDAEEWQLEVGDEPATGTEPVVSESSVQVISGAGSVSILNASGKRVVISNVLGQTLSSVTLTSDRATLPLPKGIVIIAVPGEPSLKAIVK
jgi:hypothetical protein